MITELLNAQKDFLTGFYTKSDLTPFLQRMKADSDKSAKPFSVLVIDIDNFKPINDKCGHMCGDEVLKYFSNALRLSIEGKNGFAFRFGGDEFIVVFPERDSKDVFELANQLEIDIKNGSFLWEERAVKLSFSGGVAMYPVDGKTADKIIANADKAMYFSKRSGRGKVTQYCRMRYDWLKKKILIFCVIAAISLFVYLSVRTTKVLSVYFHKLQSLIQQKIFPGQLVTVYPVPGDITDKAAVQGPQMLNLSSGKYIMIFLKTGRVADGNFVKEDGDGISIIVNFDDGRKVLATFKKDMIVKIKTRR